VWVRTVLKRGRRRKVSASKEKIQLTKPAGNERNRGGLGKDERKKGHRARETSQKQRRHEYEGDVNENIERKSNVDDWGGGGGGRGGDSKGKHTSGVSAPGVENLENNTKGWGRRFLRGKVDEGKGEPSGENPEPSDQGGKVQRSRSKMGK